MAYSWMISFSDLEDEVIIKKGDAYLTSHPNPTMNYYDLTASKFISFVNSFNLDVSVLNGLTWAPNSTNPPHYLVIQWLKTCLQMMVCENNIGLNDVRDGVQQDLYYIKFKLYRDQLVDIQSQIKYETIVTGTLQQNQTRSGGTFRIIY